MRVPDGLIYIRFGYIIHAGLISDTCFKHEDRIEREGDCMLLFIHCRALRSACTI